MSGKNIDTVNALFSTPFCRMMAGHEEHREQLKEFLLNHTCREYENSDRPQSAHSSVFESGFDLFQWQDPQITLLKSRLYSHLMQFLSTVNGFDSQTLQELKFKSESWFHVTKKGGYFQPHTHPLASFSMIYCVDPGDEAIENPHESGQVLFIDPRHNASMYLDPANRHMQRDFSFNGLKFRLRPDELCIFPSYLQHSVEPYAGDRPRITIAANFSFGMK